MKNQQYFTIARFAGPSVRDCAFLVYRSTWPDFPNEDLESFVIRHTNGVSRVVGGGPGWSMGFWASSVNPSRLYVTGTFNNRTGLSIGTPEPDGSYRWELASFNPSYGWGPELVWGIDENDLFAWGGGMEGSLVPAFMWHWDGHRWQDIPSPGNIYSMDGDRSGVFAVGANGLIARWDHHMWRPLKSPTTAGIQFITTRGPDEVYACGMNGAIYGNKRSPDGSELNHDEMVALAHLDRMPCGIIAQPDRVLVGTRQGGFFELRGQKLECIQKDLMPRMLHKGEKMMWLDAGSILESDDLIHFERFLISTLEPLLDASEEF